MKRILITLLGLIIAVSPSFAQFQQTPRASVDWNGIKLPDNTVIAISFEIENAKFGGLSYKDRVAVDPELATDLPDAVQRCVDSANHEMKKWVQSYRPQTIFFTAETEGREYHIHFIVKSVWSDGYTIADATFTTPTGVAIFSNLRGPGGQYGSFVNLMGDGFESLGKEVAKRIQKARERRKI